MMFSMFYLFSFQFMEKSNLEVLEFWVFSELAILEWFLTCSFKHFLYKHIIKGLRILMWLCYQSFVQNMYYYSWENLVSQIIAQYA